MPKFFILLLILLQSFQAFAKKEDWYWGFTLGSGQANYTGATGSTIDTLNADPNFSSSSPAGFELSLYFPLGGNGLLGAVTGGASQTYAHKTNTSLNQNIGQSLLTASYMYSFGSEPGQGVLLRADAGIGVIYNTTGTSGSFSFSDGGRVGAVRGGAGYGFKLGEETRVLLMFTAGSLLASDPANYTAFSAGFLF